MWSQAGVHIVTKKKILLIYICYTSESILDSYFLRNRISELIFFFTILLDAINKHESFMFLVYEWTNII